MNKKIKTILLLTTLCASTVSMANTGFIVDLSKNDLKIDDKIKESFNVLSVGAYKTLGEYIKVNAQYGMPFSDKQLSQKTDTFILPNDNEVVMIDTNNDGVKDGQSIAFGNVQTTDYKDVLALKYQASINLSFDIPITDNFYIQAIGGYQYTSWKVNYYESFNDHLPSATPSLDYYKGLDNCAITGHETDCGIDIVEKSYTDDLSGLFYGFGAGFVFGDDLTLSLKTTTQKDKSKKITTFGAFLTYIF